MAGRKRKDPRKQLREIIGAWPAISEKISHGAPTWWGGRKTFATLHDDHHGDGRLAVWIKSTHEAQSDLVELDPARFYVPPYLGPSGWIGVRLEPGVDWEMVERLVQDAYPMVAPKRALKQLDATGSRAPSSQRCVPIGGTFAPMGLDRELLDYIDDCVAGTLGALSGRAMLELGNQRVYGDDVAERTGKQYYEARGVDHTSFDLNGKDGALPIDLSRPCDDARWRGRFDIITNAGTTEHVEPHESQYDCFRNIHDWQKPGGITVHVVPDVHELDERGAWKDHCGNYYSREFFELLAEHNSYTLLDARIISGNSCACLRKEQDRPFTEDRAALLSKIARREGGKRYLGVNDRPLLLRPVRRFARRLARGLRRPSG